MIATATRPNSDRSRLDVVYTSDTAGPLVRRPVAEESVAVRVAAQRPRPSFLTTLLRSLSAFSV